MHIAVCQGGKIVIGDQFLVKIEESDEVGLDDGDKVFGELGRIESKDEAPRFDYGGTTFAERADVMKLNTASRLGEATIWTAASLMARMKSWVLKGMGRFGAPMCVCYNCTPQTLI